MLSAHAPDTAARAIDTERHGGDGGGMKNIIPLLLGLSQDLSKGEAAAILKAWNPDGSQIELIDLLIEQLTAAPALDSADLAEELAHALSDPAISDLLPEADALQILDVLAKVKAAGSPPQ
jgi:hypothetical protein